MHCLTILQTKLEISIRSVGVCGLRIIRTSDHGCMPVPTLLTGVLGNCRRDAISHIATQTRIGSRPMSFKNDIH